VCNAATPVPAPSRIVACFHLFVLWVSLRSAVNPPCRVFPVATQSSPARIARDGRTGERRRLEDPQESGPAQAARGPFSLPPKCLEARLELAGPEAPRRPRRQRQQSPTQPAKNTHNTGTAPTPNWNGPQPTAVDAGRCELKAWCGEAGGAECAKMRAAGPQCATQQARAEGGRRGPGACRHRCAAARALESWARPRRCGRGRSVRQ
jgi:hypothetical protein